LSAIDRGTFRCLVPDATGRQISINVRRPQTIGPPPLWNGAAAVDAGAAAGKTEIEATAVVTTAATLLASVWEATS
jgi:hypothetical protein